MTVFYELWRIINTNRRLFLLVLFLSIILASVGPYALFTQAYFIDTIESMINKDVNMKNLVLATAILASSLLLPSMNILLDFIKLKIVFIFKNSWNERINKIISQIPYWLYEDENTYDKIKTICENNLYNIMFSFFSLIISTVISIILYSIILVRVSIWLLLTVIILAPLVSYCSSKAAEKQFYRTYSLNPDKRHGLYKSSVLRDRDFAKEIRINNSNEYMLSDWIMTQKEIDDKSLKINFKYGFYGATIEKTDFILNLLSLMIILVSFLSGYITIGFFISLSNQVFKMRILSKIKDISAQYGMLKSTLLFFNNTSSFVPKAVNSDIHTNSIDSIDSVIFKNVSFKYPNSDKYVLRNISFQINKQESIAIVGENGAGKSTLIKLLLGLYEPTEGKIEINGINISALSPIEKSKIFGVAFQDYAKFALKLFENISFDVDDSSIRDISDQLNIDSIIKNHDKGYNVTLGKIYGESIDISGGQWQSIAIARALCGESKEIFVFDEPTAALDPISEVDVFKKINEITKNKITIYITHRLGYTSKVDKVILIKNNSILENGSFNELMMMEGEFHYLYNKQKSFYI